MSDHEWWELITRLCQIRLFFSCRTQRLADKWCCRISRSLALWRNGLEECQDDTCAACHLSWYEIQHETKVLWERES